MKRIKLFLTSCLCCVFLAPAFGQNIQVTGVVTDAVDNSPLPSATVMIKGTQTVAITQANGSYSIMVPANGVLVFSFAGMDTQEIAVNRQTKIDVSLVSTNVLDAVVITAMGVSREKKSIGYASQEIKADDITQAKQTDLNNALAGRVAGVRMWGASGATFDAGSIVLRGTTSLSGAGSSPIYVVDGVITNVESVNMDDVESLNVLKGPAATAIYGSRGGNGAVIIATKRAELGKTQFEFSQTFNFERVNMQAEYQSEYGGGALGAEADLMTFNYNPSAHPAYLQALNGKKYYDMWNDMSWGPKFDGQQYAPFYAWDPTHPKFGTTIPWEGQPGDNLKDLFRMGFTSNTNIAFSHSIGKLRTRMSFSNVSRQGVIENSDAIRRNFSLNVNYDVNDRLKISAGYRYTYRKNHNAGVEGYGGTGNFAYSYAQWFHRNVDFADLKDFRRPDGTFRSWNPTSVTNMTPAYHDNPYALMEEIQRDNANQWNNINATLSYDIIKSKLTIGATYNGSFRNYLSELKVPYNLTDEVSRYEMTQNAYDDNQVQAYVSYADKFFDNRFDISARVYAEDRTYVYNNLTGFTRDGLTSNYFYNLSASMGQPGGSNRIEKREERAIFGMAILSWDNTYYLDLTLRNDWASTLPKNENSYLYGGASVSVLLSNFTKNAKWLNFWKIRASAAQVGSAMSVYQVEETYTFGTRYGSSSAMYMPTNLKDPHIKPSISTSYEIGTEFQMFKYRLYGDINFYNRDAKDQIIDINTAPTSGYSTVKVNAGKIRNRGWEVSLGGTPIKTKNITWEIYANWAHNVNTLIELDPNNPELTQYSLDWFGFSTRVYNFAEVGKPMGIIRGTDWERSPDGQIVLTKRNPGDATGEYIPVRRTSAQEELGNQQPDATGGFGTSFSWKSFRLSMGFDFQIGGDVASVTNLFGEGSGLLESTVGLNDKGNPIRNDYRNGGGVRLDGVVKEADGSYTPASGYINASPYFQNYAQYMWSPYVFDASYLKMRELSLSYAVPAKFLQKMNIGLHRASVSAIVQNPWLIYSGIPNVDASNVGNSRRGYLELGQISNTTTFGFSINLIF